MRRRYEPSLYETRGGSLLLSTDELSPQDLLALKVIEHLTNDAADTFSAAEQAVEELDERLQDYPLWRAALWGVGCHWVGDVELLLTVW